MASTVEQLNAKKKQLENQITELKVEQSAKQVALSLEQKRLEVKINKFITERTNLPNDASIEQVVKKLSMLEKRKFKKFTDKLSKVKEEVANLKSDFERRIEKKEEEIKPFVAEINNLIKITELTNKPEAMKKYADELKNDFILVEASPKSEPIFRGKWSVLEEAISQSNKNVDLSDVKAHLTKLDGDNKYYASEDQFTIDDLTENAALMQKGRAKEQLEAQIAAKKVIIEMRKDFTSFLQSVISTLPDKKVEAVVAPIPAPDTPRASHAPSSSSSASPGRAESELRAAPLVPLERANVHVVQENKKASSVKGKIDFFNQLAEEKSVEASKTKPRSKPGN